MSIIDIVLELPMKMADLVTTLQEWIFTGVTIGDVNVSFWTLLGGVLIASLIVYSIVRS